MATTTKSKRKSGGHARARKSETTTNRSSRGRVKSSRPPSQSSLGNTAAKMLAGATNAMRALVPQLAPGDTATALLTKQHREVEQSFAAALDTEDARVRRAAMNDIRRQLTMHTRIEETIFYPAVQGLDAAEAKDMVLEAYEEHHVVKLVLKELPKVDPKAETFKAKMTVLKELVAHHVKEEEREMFPMAESELGPECSRELAEAMAASAARE